MPRTPCAGGRLSMPPMQDNPYAPPLAAVQDVPLTARSQAEAPWFSVSLTKLVVMLLCTLMMYQLYWLYQQWRRVKEREQLDILPAARAFFAIFFVYQLFGKVREFDTPSGRNRSLAAGALAAGWIITSLLWRLPDPYWLVAFTGILFLLPVQAQANAINAEIDPAFDRNDRFTLLNWLVIVPGSLLYLLAMIGLWLPD